MKIASVVLLLALSCMFALTPDLTFAQQNAQGRLEYAPLEPLTPNTQTYPNIGSYLNAAFSALLTLGALFAVVTFTIGGVVYMTSDAIGKKSAAVDRMKASIWGLLLLAASVLILQTINPGLLNFDLGDIGQRLRFQNSTSGGGNVINTSATYYCQGGTQAGQGTFGIGSQQLAEYTARCEAGNGRIYYPPY